MKKLHIIFFATGIIPLLLVSIISLSLPKSVSAEEVCTFTRDLDVGSEGEEVRCLQKYLNAKGYTISSSGPGSPGSETTMFGGKTKEALMKWQTAMRIWPVSGSFGPVSRSVYDVNEKKPQVVVTTAQSSSGSTTEIPAVNNSESQNNSSSQDNSVKKALKRAIDAIEEAEDIIDDEDDDGDSTDEEIADMKERVEKAKEKLFDAVSAYVSNDHDEATTLAAKAEQYAEDAVEDISNEENEADAEEALNDADAAIDEARDKINEAEDDDEDTDEARDLYDEARDKYRDAQEAFDDEDFEEAIELAEDAENLAEDAMDAL
jgi:peptidoglycan hydrolase-like protein with peptidoglycan-binding domain